MSITVKRPRALIVTVTAAAAVVATAAVAKNWGDWTPPVSIESGGFTTAVQNTAGVDGCPSLSPDGLELYFASNRAGSLGAVDIWVARRASVDEGFGPPENLGAPINSATNDICPTMTRSGRLYYTSGREDSDGDLYVVRRGPKGWGEPVSLGPNINSPAIEESPAIFEDEDGRQIIYFSSGRSGVSRIYYSIDGSPAALAGGGVNSSAEDKRPGISKDGLEIFWDSTRAGGLGGSDFYTARRSSTSEPFGSAIHLPNLSGPGFDARPFLSWDGSTLLFASIRPGGEGNIDTYMTSRSHQTGQ